MTSLLILWEKKEEIWLYGIKVMILMPQIFDVTANENACNKRNELEFTHHG